MHLHFADSEPVTVEVEDHFTGVFGEQGHGHGTVRDLLGDHECGKSLPEGIVMVTGMPDGDSFRFPGFFGTHCHSGRGNILHGSAAGGTGILDQGDGMQFHLTGSQLEVFFRSGGIVGIFAFPAHRVIEGPVFGFPLTALHGDAAELVIGLGVLFRIFAGEVKVFSRHHQFRTDSAEAQIHIGFGEAQGEVDIGRFAVHQPFIHAPEMAVLQGKIHFVDHLCHQGKLFGGADGSADPGRSGRGCLFPGIDVFQSFCTVEFLQRIIDIDFEAGAFKTFQRVNGDFGGIVQNGTVQRGVIPPVFGNFAVSAHFFIPFCKGLKVDFV